MIAQIPTLIPNRIELISSDYYKGYILMRCGFQ